ncbi:MAG: ADP-ribosylglycohydrolase family protein [Planctomycetota bacterium]|nr:MAG: ADP-ribosylglycohydrolase family protein [Planctomycetota bacterium]
MPHDPLRSRYRGALLGLATGDALGTTLEFSPPGSFEPIADLVGGGPFELAPGQWTDDTSLALCLAESLIERGGFDAIDQLERYVCWWREGYLSSTGSCFDIGNTTRRALSRFVETGEPFPGPTDPQTAGNGSLMRLAPVPLAFAFDPDKAIRKAATSSATTHGARTALDACRYFAGLLLGALAGEPKATLLSERYSPVPGLWERQPLCPEVDAVACGSFLRKRPPEIRGTGYVVDCLEAALWAFASTDSFRAGALAAVNLGDDADTTGAVFGQIAGCFYGVEAIPAPWRERLVRRRTIERLADGLLALRRRLEARLGEPAASDEVDPDGAARQRRRGDREPDSVD